MRKTIPILIISIILMEANQWNNFTAGTCACDDLIAQGKEPCPQCERGLCKEEGSTCNYKPNNTQ